MYRSIREARSLLYSYIYCALLEVAKKGLSLTCAQLLVFVVVMRVLLSWEHSGDGLRSRSNLSLHSANPRVFLQKPLTPKHSHKFWPFLNFRWIAWKKLFWGWRDLYLTKYCFGLLIDLQTTSKGKVENILKGSLDSIPSPSSSVKIRIIGRRCKGKSWLGTVNKLLKTKSLLFESSLKVKVMGLNPGYPLKSFLF